MNDRRSDAVRGGAKAGTARAGLQGVTLWSRRRLLAVGGLSLGSLALGRSARAAPTVAVSEPWADVVELGDRVWGVISKPLGGDYKTVCNGGIVAGSERVLVVEAFVGPEGARWVADVARRLTGRLPTDVVVSHFHGDHVGGLSAFAVADEAPRLWSTPTTRDLITGDVADVARGDHAEALDESGPTEIDLGGRAVRVVPRRGHTPSDVTLEIEDPGVVFLGDLIWNQMFPNYMSAIPSELSASVRSAVEVPASAWVPGHGPMASASDLQLFVGVIDSVEELARRSFEQGKTAAEAASDYALPEAAADWTFFNARYPETAISAWYRELEAR